jgi:hypothetical protein
VKYFVIQGLIPEAYYGAPHLGRKAATRQERIRRWRAMQGKLPIEGEQVFFRLPNIGRISVLVHDVCDSLLMVFASSQRKAYNLALPFRSYFTIYVGRDLANNDGEFLLELRGKPRAAATARDIACLYRPLTLYPINPDSVLSTLKSGVTVTHAQIKSACEFVTKVLAFPQLVTSLMHLERSYFLFAGHMASSYHYRHYRQQRESESAYLREKMYLEERTLYDLAFLSAFRALEALLGATQIKKLDIGIRLHALDDKFRTSFRSTRWKSFYEVLSSGRKRWRFDELIARYLDVRNAVAAHANPRPPFLLHEDQVREIQLLAKTMLYDAAGRPPLPIV